MHTETGFYEWLALGVLLERHSVLHEVCGVCRQWDVERQIRCSVCSADKRVIGEGTQ